MCSPTAADVTLLAHVQPDADSLGSALALGIALHRRGAAVRVAFATPDEMPDTLRPLDVLGLVVPPSAVPAAPGRRGGVRRRRARPARRAGRRLRRRPRLDHDRPPRVQPRLRRRPAARPGCGGDGRARPPGARRRWACRSTSTSPAASTRASSPTPWASARRACRPPAGGRAVGAGVEPDALVRPLMDTHPFGWFAALARALGGCVLEPDAAGGLGLVHTAVPPPSRPLPVRGDRQRRRHRPHRGRGRGRARAQAGGRAAVAASLRSKGTVDVAARGGPARWRRPPRRRPGSPATARSAQVLSEVRSALAAHDRPLAS